MYILRSYVAAFQKITGCLGKRLHAGGTGQKSWENRSASVGGTTRPDHPKHSHIEKVRDPSGKPGWGKKQIWSSLENCIFCVFYVANAQTHTIPEGQN